VADVDHPNGPIGIDVGEIGHRGIVLTSPW
jgi:hypothetical protein